MAIKVKEVVVRFEENDDPEVKTLTVADYQPLKLTLHHHKMAEVADISPPTKTDQQKE